MITKQEDRSVIRSGEFREQHFKLAQNAHIFKILRDGIYSDKALAVVREYWANARDEHTKLGKPELPVDITLPSYLEPYLKIRDYGKGLSRKEVEDVYISYGTSTKTDSNEFIGALGIGSKSGFCYTSAFQVTSFTNGKAAVYSCYIDETEMGKIAHVSTDATEEPDGVEISVPINTSDFHLFQDKIRQLFLYSKQRPNIKGSSNFKFNEPVTLIKGDFWAVLESDASFCMMGDIPYTFDKNVFRSTYSSVVGNLRKEEQVRQEVLVEEGTLKKVDVNSVIKYPVDLPAKLNSLLEYNILLRFDIGDIEMAASREALSYRTKTIIGIYEKLVLMVKAIEDTIKLDIDNCKTLWDVKKLYAKYFEHVDSASVAGLLRAIGNTTLTWNDKKIVNAHIDWAKAKIHPPKPAPVAPPVGIDGKPITDPLVLQAITPPPAPEPLSCMLYKRKHNGKIEKVLTGDIEATRATNRIIINDTGTIRGIFTSMNALMPRDNYAAETYYVFEYLNKDNYDSLVKFLADNGIPSEHLSAIVIPKADRAASRPSPKYSKKIFLFNSSASALKDSDYWDIAEVDPEEEEGIYVSINRYAPQFNGVATIKSLITVKKFIEEIEKKPLVIYGVKSGSVDTLGENWTKLEKYCLDVGAKLMADANYEQILADYQHLEAFTQGRSALELFLGVYKHSKDIVPETAEIHAVHKPIRALIDNHKKYKEKEELAEMMRILGKTPDNKIAPTCNIEDILEKKFFTTYPMIKHAQTTYRGYYDTVEKRQFLLDAAAYIKCTEATR